MYLTHKKRKYSIFLFFKLASYPILCYPMLSSTARLDMIFNAGL